MKRINYDKYCQNKHAAKRGLAVAWPVWVSYLLFLQRALQRMLGAFSGIHDLGNLGFCDFECVNAAGPNTGLMHIEHNLCGFL